MISHIGTSLGQFNWLLLNCHVCSVPILGEFIAIIDEAVSSVHFDAVSALKIRWAVVRFVFEAHSRAMGENWRFGKPLLLEEHREWVKTGVLSIDLLDFDLSIGEVVV